MQKQFLQTGRANRHGCVLILATFIFLSRPAFASSDQPTPLSDTSTVAGAIAPALPDAPSTVHPASPALSIAGDEVPLEQQAHPLVTPAKVPLNIVHDLANIAVSPARIRTNDLKWLLPMAGATAAAFVTDTHTMTQVASSNPSFNQTSINVSNGLVGGIIAIPVALFGVGSLQHQERPKETGILGSEAMADAFIVDQVIKLCTFRERPNVDGAQGEFYIGKSGIDSSFVSGHSMVAWSSAAVIAGEYPSKWAQLGVYTLATGVSLTRVMGQQHFPSDVLLGAAGGWLIGHYVFRAHHHVPLQHAVR